MARPHESREPRAPGDARLGEVLAGGDRIALVVSAYHADVTGEMCASARDTLREAGLSPEVVLEVWTPGSFELPVVAQRLARRPDVRAVLCLGLVLRGETTHDRHIATAVAQGLMQVGLATDTPVLFGVLTCDTLDQARVRARRATDGGLDKGREVALAALEVLAALREASGRPVVREESRR